MERYSNHLEELVAPRWPLDKARTLNLIRQVLVDRATWQGKMFRTICSSLQGFGCRPLTLICQVLIQESVIRTDSCREIAIREGYHVVLERY